MAVTMMRAMGVVVVMMARSMEVVMMIIRTRVSMMMMMVMRQDHDTAVVMVAAPVNSLDERRGCFWLRRETGTGSNGRSCK